MRRAYVLAALLVLTSVAAAQEKAADSPAPVIQEEYRLVVGDEIEVTVIGQPDYSLGFQVPAGGRKRYPPIGYLELAGRKVVDIEEEIQRKFADMKILVDPQVSVVVISYSSRRVYLTGAVYQVVELPVHREMRLLQVIAQAGGWGLGDKRNVRIIRERADGSRYPIPINAQEILDEEAWDKNIKIMPEDMIYIPPQVSADEQQWVYVLGYVRSPTPVPLMRGRDPITLMRLVSIVGGFDQYARTGAIKIIRKMEGRSRIIIVDFDEILDGERDDVVLEADDVVYVPESIF